MYPTKPISFEVNAALNTFLAVGAGVGFDDNVGIDDIEGLALGAILFEGFELGSEVGIEEMDGSKLGIVDTDGNELG